MKTPQMTPAFAENARNALIDKGGLLMPRTQSLTFMKAGSSLHNDDMLVVMIDAAQMPKIAECNKGFNLSGFERWNNARLARFIDIAASQPSRRPEIPRGTYGYNELRLTSGVELAALMLHTGISAVPIEMTPMDVDRLNEDGIKVTSVISSRNFPGYAAAGTEEMYRQHMNRITPPTAACAAIRHDSNDELGDLIATMSEVSPLLAAEQVCAEHYKRLIKEYNVTVPETNPVLREMNANAAQFHLSVIEAVLPYLEDLHQAGQRTIPTAPGFHIPTMVDSEDPIADTAEWIEQTWLEEVRRHAMAQPRHYGPRKAA